MRIRERIARYLEVVCCRLIAICNGKPLGGGPIRVLKASGNFQTKVD